VSLLENWNGPESCPSPRGPCFQLHGRRGGTKVPTGAGEQGRDQEKKNPTLRSKAVPRRDPGGGRGRNVSGK